MTLESRLPPRFDLGRAYSTTLSAPIFNYEAYQNAVELDDKSELFYMNPLGLPTIMGYVIPKFQRPLVWTQDQSIKFIESLFLGLPVGTYTINVDGTYGKGNPETRNILVDGQQRMFALQQFLTDVFPVFGLKYSEFNVLEKRIIKNISWQSYETSSQDEAFIRDYYNRMNFGGTAHTKDQMA